MTNNSRTSVILVVLVIIIAGAAAYMLFAKPDTSAITEEAPGSEAESSFLSLTAQIGTISFDTAVFSDPRFAALRDIRTTVVPEAAGRPDPFAPLSGIQTPKP